MAAAAVKGASDNNEVKKIQDNTVINARDPDQVSAYYVILRIWGTRFILRVCVCLYAAEDLRHPSPLV